MKHKVILAKGDGIGPEITEAVVSILEVANVPIEFKEIELGEMVFLRGHPTGIEPDTWDILEKTPILLKAPITTPQGGGFKSLNVTLRSKLGLYANVRPFLAYAPFVETHFPKLDLVIIRENEEDLYAGIEHRQTQDSVQCLKLITKKGCERIIRYAFEYAVTNSRKKVSCMTKDNIMKLTDGLFHKTFNEIALEYPEIETDHYIIDIGSARLASDPERFDVIVTLNLYGDIISDIAAEVAGSVGLSGSSNIGEKFAMFEAIHGSAPDIAGKGIANPSGFLLGAIMMLSHLGLAENATTIHNALLKTLEDGIHTGDIFSTAHSKKLVGTKEFTSELLSRLGEKPVTLRAVQYSGSKSIVKIQKSKVIKKEIKKLVGIDLFLEIEECNLGDLSNKVIALLPSTLSLTMISNRGTMVWPETNQNTLLSDHWRLRIVSKDQNLEVNHRELLDILEKLDKAELSFIKIENLYLFDGKAGF